MSEEEHGQAMLDCPIKYPPSKGSLASAAVIFRRKKVLVNSNYICSKKNKKQ